MILGVDLGLRVHLGAESQTTLADAVRDDLLQTGERTRDDEQHVGGVDLDEFLMRMLAAALRGHRRLRALQDLQQRLLHALTGDVAGDRRVLALAGDLVDLVDVDDAGFGALDVVVGGLDQLEQNVLDVLADVSGFRQCGGVGDREWDIEHLGQRLREIGLAAAGGSKHQDVGLGQLDGLGARIAHLLLRLNALVVVVNGDSQRALSGVLTDYIALEEIAYFDRLRQLVEFDVIGVSEFLFDDLVAQVNAFIADIDARARDELLDLFLTLPAE